MAGTCMSRFRQGKASSSLHLYRWCNFISHSGFQSEHPSCHSFRYARRQLRAPFPDRRNLACASRKQTHFGGRSGSVGEDQLQPESV